MTSSDYTAPDSAPWPVCWSCLKPFRDGRTGVSLDDSGNPNVCRQCWRELPPVARIAFQMAGPTLAWITLAISQRPGQDDEADWWKWLRGDDRN